MDISLLSSVHIRFGDLAFNLFAVESRELVNLEKAMHIAFCLDICAAFSMDSVQVSIFFPPNIFMDNSTACIMVCSIMMDDSKLL